MSDASIEFACPYCDRISRVPASFAGKQGKCPGCDEVIEVPDPSAGADAPTVLEPPPQPIGTPVRGGLSDDPALGPGGPERPCPACGESIKVAAIKCRFCGEYLDGHHGSRQSIDMAARAEEMPNAGDWLLCIFCGWIGCIIGIVYLTRGYTKKGAIMIAVPFALGFLQLLVLMLMGA